MNPISKHSIEIERKTPYDISCTVSYSAPMEEVFCINALLDPQEHLDRKFWLRKKRESLSSSLLSEMLFFKNHYNLFFLGDLVEYLSVGLSPEDCTLERIVQAIQEMDHVNFTYIVLGFSAFRYPRSHVEKLCSDPDSVTKEDLGEQKNFYTVEDAAFFLKHIPDMQRRLAWILEAYWRESFCEDWKHIEPILRDLAEREKETVETRGVVSYIESLHQNVDLKDGMFLFHKQPDFFIPVKEVSRINVSLSSFLSNSDLAANIIDDTLYVTKYVNVQSVIADIPVSAELLSLIKACSDEIRLKIMRILYNGEATTQSLAEILLLSPSAVSIHLKQLKEAGLVLYRKEKKYVYYRLNLSVLTNLQHLLMQCINEI